MPKKIITKRTLPIALNELDKWKGKLTMKKYTDHLARVLGVEKISRHTIASYPSLQQAFTDRKLSIKESNSERSEDITLELAKSQIETLKAKVARLEIQNERLYEQFVRWQHNAYMMQGIDMKKLNQNLDKPLIEVKRRRFA